MTPASSGRPLGGIQISISIEYPGSARPAVQTTADVDGLLFEQACRSGSLMAESWLRTIFYDRIEEVLNEMLAPLREAERARTEQHRAVQLLGSAIARDEQRKRRE